MRSELRDILQVEAGAKFVYQGRAEGVDILRLEVVYRISASKLEVRVDLRQGKVAVRIDVMSEQLILAAEIVVHADYALMNRQIAPR